jgi:hypothetical protein
MAMGYAATTTEQESDMTLPLLRSCLATACLLLLLGACERAPSDSQVDAGDAAVPPPLDQPVEDVAPATAPVSPTPSEGLARYDGYGDMRFGMSADEAKKAWGGELNGKPSEGTTCYHLNPISNPTPAYFAFMIEDGKFVRYDVSNDKEVAPGGGKRGMTSDEIKKLYPEVTEQGHKYVEGGKYLRVKDDAGGNGVLVFETDAAGKVTEWRVGVPPQVDYVEGCS